VEGGEGLRVMHDGVLHDRTDLLFAFAEHLRG